MYHLDIGAWECRGKICHSLWSENEKIRVLITKKYCITMQVYQERIYETTHFVMVTDKTFAEYFLKYIVIYVIDDGLKNSKFLSRYTIKWEGTRKKIYKTAHGISWCCPWYFKIVSYGYQYYDIGNLREHWVIGLLELWFECINFRYIVITLRIDWYIISKL